jgi:hypothetical protein
MTFDSTRQPRDPWQPRLFVAALAVSILAALAFFAFGATRAPGAGAPKLIQLSYDHTRDGSSKHFNLSAYAHKADSVRFVVRRHHKPVAVPGRYNSHVTDTDLHPDDASHPWEVNRKQGGKKVLKAVRASLKHKGMATVRVIARNGNARAKAKVTINVATCTKDPPFYPLSCEIGL